MLRLVGLLVVAGCFYALAFVIIAAFWYERAGQLDAAVIALIALAPALAVLALLIWVDQRDQRRTKAP